MNILNYITDADYRLHCRRERAKDLIRQRHQQLERHVYIQDIFKLENGKYNKYSCISIDGVRISPYVNTVTDDILKELADIRHRYYILHRHNLLSRHAYDY